MTRFARGCLLLQHVAWGLLLQAKVSESVGVVSKLDRFAVTRSSALSVGVHGNVINFEDKHDWATGMHVRREQASRGLLQRDPLPRAAIEKGAVVLELKENSTSPKLIAICLSSIVALVLMCYMTFWLIWQPLNAIFEERAYEQAAQAAMLAGEIKPPPDTMAADAVSAHKAEQIKNRQEKLDIAWMQFLDNPLLAIKASNLLAKLMRDLLDKDAFHIQLEDLFGALATDGADTLKREQLERVCEAVEGELHNMHVKETISHVDYENGTSCSMAVTEVEDYGWLFDNYDKMFPEDAPLNRKCFVGIVSLVVVWNCVRTLHTARHMQAEEGQHDAETTEQSGKVRCDIKIDLRTGFPLKAHAEIVFDPNAVEEVQPKSPMKKSDSWSDDDRKAKAGGSASSAAA